MYTAIIAHAFQFSDYAYEEPMPECVLEEAFFADYDMEPELVCWWLAQQEGQQQSKAYEAWAQQELREQEEDYKRYGVWL